MRIYQIAAQKADVVAEQKYQEYLARLSELNLKNFINRRLGGVSISDIKISTPFQNGKFGLNIEIVVALSINYFDAYRPQFGHERWPKKYYDAQKQKIISYLRQQVRIIKKEILQNVGVVPSIRIMASPETVYTSYRIPPSLEQWIDRIKNNPLNYHNCPKEYKDIPEIKNAAIHEWARLLTENKRSFHPPWDHIRALTINDVPPVLRNEVARLISQGTDVVDPKPKEDIEKMRREKPGMPVALSKMNWYKKSQVFDILQDGG